MKLRSLVFTGSFLANALAFQAQFRVRIRPPSVCNAFVDISESVGRDVGAMDEWATMCEVQRAEGFQLTSEDGFDWSVMTNQDLPAGSPVLFVSAQMIFSANRLRDEFGGGLQAAVELLGRLDADAHAQNFYIFIKILNEWQMGDQSPWYPWLNSLPRSFCSGAAMTPVCYECLPPLVSSLAMAERVKFINFEAALKTVDFISEEVKNNKDLTRWAYNIVYTRSFESDGDVRLTPMVDMFNHGTETEVDTQFDENGNCNVFTTRDVPAGSPLRISYGDPTNPSQLFATYGFLDESAPATFCKIMRIKPSTELKNVGLDFSRMLFYKDTGDVSEEVWDVLLYDILSSKSTQDRQAFYQAHMNGDVETKNAIHQSYYSDTLAALKDHVDTFLQQLDELSAKAMTKDPNEHPRIPVILQHNEFVRNTFLAVQNRLAG